MSSSRKTSKKISKKISKKNSYKKKSKKTSKKTSRKTSKKNNDLSTTEEMINILDAPVQNSTNQQNVNNNYMGNQVMYSPSQVDPLMVHNAVSPMNYNQNQNQLLSPSQMIPMNNNLKNLTGLSNNFDLTNFNLQNQQVNQMQGNNQNLIEQPILQNQVMTQSPLQGQVMTHSPLQGQVMTQSPLQGHVMSPVQNVVNQQDNITNGYLNTGLNGLSNLYNVPTFA